ncbi:phage terminase large subunit [Nesterenkonia rhizosphaerae]|uniref:Terminase family protein n=1 Tax=Nesterenkonia rhizosphaerae TaxID=1348272 RepID=A0ABP9FTP7_9MICC
MRRATTVKFKYRPHPKQLQAHRAQVDELLYGGAAGGGKSMFARAEAILLCLRVPGVRVLILRKTFKQMESSVLPKLLEEIPEELAKFHASRYEFTFKNGSVIQLGYLDKDGDLENYQGPEYQLVIFEEASQFPENHYSYLESRLRASGEVAERMEALGLFPRRILTANPTGIGLMWLKRRFVDPYPPEKVWRPKPSEEDPEPGTRVYIPARATDNPSLNKDYLKTLNRLPEDLRRALRDGDWSVLDGVRFSSWRENKHVLKPELFPISLLSGRKVIAVDYGHEAPFAAVWLCKLGNGLIIQYREAYAKGLTPVQQAELIRDLSKDEEEASGEPIEVVADPAMWSRQDAGAHKTKDGSPPVGSQAHAYQTVLNRRPIKANNSRIPGWALLDEKLRIREDGEPRFLVYNTCRDTIRTLPTLPRSKTNPEDLDTSAEDHLADAIRYGVMHLEGKFSNLDGLDDYVDTMDPMETYRIAQAEF